MRIKDMPAESRPRERLQKFGAVSLSDAELLAIIIGKGTRKENAIDVANRLLSIHPMSQLPSLSVTELEGIGGIGTTKALQINSAFEIAKRCTQKSGKTTISSPEDAFEYAHSRFPSQDKEHFMVIHLNSKNKVLRSEIVSIGIINSSLAHPREIFKSAIKENAYAIILAHNHPSGDPTPSEEDKAITEQLIHAGKLIGIPLLDHIVIGKENYFSILNVE